MATAVAPARAAVLARDLPSVTPCQLDLIVGGSSEDASCSPDFIVRVANLLGKCQDKVQAACIICVIPRIGMTSSGL